MKRPQTWTRLAALVVGALVLATTVIVPATADSAEAAPVTGFKPGNIISDANFYNGGAMTQPEVQKFLEQRVPRCTIGDSGRKAGSKWGNTTIASKCLRNFEMTTKSRPANAYCKAYNGRKESASQIIAKVARPAGSARRCSS